MRRWVMKCVTGEGCDDGGENWLSHNSAGVMCDGCHGLSSPPARHLASGRVEGEAPRFRPQMDITEVTNTRNVGRDWMRIQHTDSHPNPSPNPESPPSHGPSQKRNHSRIKRQQTQIRPPKRRTPHPVPFPPPTTHTHTHTERKRAELEICARLGNLGKEGIGQRPRATATLCRTTWPPVRGPRQGVCVAARLRAPAAPLPGPDVRCCQCDAGVPFSCLPVPCLSFCLALPCLVRSVCASRQGRWRTDIPEYGVRSVELVAWNYAGKGKAVAGSDRRIPRSVESQS